MNYLQEGDYPAAVEILFTSRNSDLVELRETYRKSQ
jgi:hypothetical protein